MLRVSETLVAEMRITKTNTTESSPVFTDEEKEGNKKLERILKNNINLFSLMIKINKQKISLEKLSW